MPISSPCTKVCTIDPRSGLCHGCGRTLGEIAQWGSMNESERLRIMADLPRRMDAKGIAAGGVDYVLALTKVEDHFEEIIESMAPQSAMALIENPARPLDITKLKPKSIGLHWEFMFTRARFQTADMCEQGRLLTEVGELMDAGRIRTTLQANFGQITAENMRRAHAVIESGRTIGKIVLAGF